MSDEGYLQIKLREANDILEKLCEREKYLTLRYDRMESLLNNELSSILKDIEDIKQIKQEIDKLPRKLFEYNKENLDQIIHNKFLEQWKGLSKRLKEIFSIQSKINAKEFQQIAKRYIVDNLDFEIQLGAIRNILFNKKIMTKEDLDRTHKEYEKRIKPVVENDLGITTRIVSIDASDFEMDELIEENKKLLE